MEHSSARKDLTGAAVPCVGLGWSQTASLGRPWAQPSLAVTRSLSLSTSIPCQTEPSGRNTINNSNYRNH